MEDAYGRYESATAGRVAPFALVDLDAFRSNAADMERRAGGKLIRLATKSIRCRHLQESVLARSGFAGVLAFTLAEGLWLASSGVSDVVIGYPTADTASLSDLGERLRAGEPGSVTLMVDDAAQLDLIGSAVGATSTPVDVCIDIDAGWSVLGGKVKIGAKRSPLHSVSDVVTLAQVVEGRAGFRLRGLMAYESQIAGVGDHPKGALRGIAIRAMQKRSAAELRIRRAEIVEAVSSIAPLEFVNGGGTGSIEATAAEDAVTEIGAGSGLFGPALFDTYSTFTPRPAALFALPVVRRPGPGVATVLGGGYPASGPPGKDRLPVPFLPEGLELDAQEGAGEVQTPVLGSAADRLRVGDRVYLRHAKAGELCERFDSLLLIDGADVTGEAPTYRGEGKTFL